MAEDFYNDSPSPPPSSDPAVEAQENEAGDDNVALLPKSFFPSDKPLEPGSVCRVKVQEVQEDQVLVTYEREESGEAEEAPAVMPMRDEEMAQYMG